MNLRLCRTLVTVSLSCTLCSLSHAALDITRLGLLPTLGNQLDVVVEVPETGSHLDRNQHTRTALPGDEFREFTLRAARKLAAGLKPDISLVEMPLVGNATPPWTVRGDRFAPEPEFATTIERVQLSHLLLITPQRGLAHMRLANVQPGHGTVEGLGFYIDRRTHTRRSDTQESGVGFLAPFAYFKVELIDTANQSVQCTHSVSNSRAFSSTRNEKNFNVWETLSAERKVTELRRLIHEGLEEALTDCLR